MAISYEVRKLVMAAYEKGMEVKEILMYFKISEGTFYNLKKLKKETNDVAKRNPSPGAPPAITVEQFQAYMSQEKKQQKTQQEMANEWEVCADTIRNMRKKTGYTRQKKT
jgi:transposase